MSPGPDVQARPFTDPAIIPGLYADQDRVRRRSTALLDAKISGHHTATMIAELAAQATGLPPGAVIADVGCGGGQSTRVLAHRFPQSHILAIDASDAMLGQVRAHLNQHLPAAVARGIGILRADFHQLPLKPGQCRLIVAMFCLYHSLAPRAVIAEFARSLQTGGAAILATKNLRAYHELDILVAATGLDPQAAGRPSLYESAHGQVLPALAAPSLHVSRVVRDRHVFRFRDAAHVAAYLVTVPKYQLRGSATGPLLTADAVAAELRKRRGDGPVVTSSIITYVVAHRETA
jgi:ubiquinone/menaquinone biosynthesis C-methylase UbiE